MQAALDTAVLAVAPTASSLSSSDLVTNVTQIFNVNVNRPELTGTAITATWDSSVSKLSATATASEPTRFVQTLGVSTLTVGANSAAVVNGNSTSTACIMALDSSSSPNVKGIIGAGAGALNASGSGTINLTGCNIYVNSTSKVSIDVTGGGTISADYVYTSGSYSGDVQATKAASKAPTTGAPAIGDPYASTRSIPSWSGCTGPTSWTGNISNPTGVVAICGNVTVSGATTLSPGVYIIADGSLTSSKAITGTGVTIILTSTNPSKDNGIFDFKAGATLTLSAPTTGSTAGITLWADGNLPHNADQFFAGTTGNITGAVYLPSHLVNYSGSATAGSSCTQLIAAEIAVSGGASFQHQCSGTGVLDPNGPGGTAYLTN